jgi:ABC-type oligopeptide transport system substrate-binding subunit
MRHAGRIPAALLIAALCACSHAPSPGEALALKADARVLVRGGGPDPDSLDPQKARGFEAQSVLRDLCEA